MVLSEHASAVRPAEAGREKDREIDRRWHRRDAEAEEHRLPGRLALRVRSHSTRWLFSPRIRVLAGDLALSSKRIQRIDPQLAKQEPSKKPELLGGFRCEKSPELC